MKTRCHDCGQETNRHVGSQYCWPCHDYRKKIMGDATGQVSRAINAGALPKLDGSIPCVDCGGVAGEYDHRDYSKPLDVDPTCGSCNKRRGPGKIRRPDTEIHAEARKSINQEDLSGLPSWERGHGITPKQIVRQFGSQANAARVLGVTRQAVNGWFRSGHVPQAHQRAIENLTDGALMAGKPKPHKRA